MTYILCDILPGKRLVVEAVAKTPEKLERARVDPGYIAPQQAILVTDGEAPPVGWRYMPYRHPNDNVRVWESRIDLGLPRVEREDAIEFDAVGSHRRPREVTPWMTAAKLAAFAEVSVSLIRQQAKTKGISRAIACTVERRETTPEDDAGRMKYLYRLVPHEAVLPGPRIDPADGVTPWMLAEELAKRLGVRHNNIRAAAKKGSVVARHYIIDRKPAPKRLGGNFQHIYRARKII